MSGTKGIKTEAAGAHHIFVMFYRKSDGGTAILRV